MKNLIGFGLFGACVIFLFACNKEFFNEKEHDHHALIKGTNLSASLENSASGGLFRIMSDPSCGNTETIYVSTDDIDMLTNTRRIKIVKHIISFTNLGAICDAQQITIRDETLVVFDTIRSFSFDENFSLPHDTLGPLSPPSGCLIYPAHYRFDIDNLLALNFDYFNQSFENAKKHLIVYDLYYNIRDNFMHYIDFGQVDPYDTYGTEKVKFGVFSYVLAQNLGSSFATTFVNNAFPGNPPNTCGQMELKETYLHMVDAFDSGLITGLYGNDSYQNIANYIIAEIQAYRM